MIPIGDDAPLARTPVVTYALLATNAAAFAYFAMQAGLNRVLADYGFAPATADAAALARGLVLNGGAGALLFNMLFLYLIGRTFEDTLGRPAFLLYYVVGGVTALGLYVLVHPFGRLPVDGVTGAVAAVLVGYLVLFPRGHIRFRYWAGNFYLPTWFCVALWFAGALIISFLRSRGATTPTLGQWVYGGGVVAGLGMAVPIRGMAGRMTTFFEETGADDLRLPHMVQQHEQARRRADSGASGELTADATGQWAAQIEHDLLAGHHTQAIRTFERRAALHSMDRLAPRARYGLADACLDKGRYWRAATLLEGLVTGAVPPNIKTSASTLLAALYGEHPYFHESAAPHLAFALENLPPGAPARKYLHEIKRKVKAARAKDLEVRPDDRFCVVRQTAEAYSISTAAPIVAMVAKRDISNVMRDLRNNRGILEWKLSRRRAFDLAAALSHAGVHVGLVPLSALQGYEKVQRLDYIGVKPDGVELHFNDESLAVPWDNLALVSGGYLVLTTDQQRQLYDESHKAALESGDAVASFDSMMRELRHLTLVDFWLREPKRHFRVREHPLRMPEAQLQSVISAMLRYAPNVPRNDGLSAAAGGVVSADCLFDHRDDFTYYGVWHVQLQQWDQLAPVSDSLIYNLRMALRGD